jgi:two-component system chemotaxis response regulator CheY
MTDHGYWHRALVVDDMATIRDVLSRYLLEIGFSAIDTAIDGKDAWEKLKLEAGLDDPYQIVFLDINMPESNGIEVLKLMRASEIYKEIPIIMVSTESEQSSVLKALEEGATNYILKPFDLTILTKKIEEVIGKRKIG